MSGNQTKNNSNLTDIFSGLEYFCVFVGEPRSGHSVVGTIINAHRNALISHNLGIFDYISRKISRYELFSLILERDRWLFERNREIGGYSYNIPEQWLGYYEELRVIGDKRAGATSRYLSRHPTALAELSSIVGLPICVIHHIRNPWDNISSIYSRKILGQERSLSESADFYFDMLDGCMCGLSEADAGIKVVRTYHEELVSDPVSVVKVILDSLSLPIDDEFLSGCQKFVHDSPRMTRYNVDWPEDLRIRIEDKIQEYEFLRRYSHSVP